MASSNSSIQCPQRHALCGHTVEQGQACLALISNNHRIALTKQSLESASCGTAVAHQQLSYLR